MSHHRRAFALKAAYIAGAMTLFLGFAAFAHAASVELRPAVIEERAEPGDVYKTSLRVTNLDAQAQTFTFVVRDVESVSEDGKPAFSTSPNPLSGIAEWVALPFKSLTLAGGETREVPIVVTVPKDAPAGGHFGGIFVSIAGSRPTETGTGIGYDVGSILSLRIAGDVTEEARIREFKTDATVYRAPTVKFSTRIENLGNVLVRPHGPIEIADMFGRTVATLLVNQEGAAIFPKTERTYEAGWTGGRWTIGRFQATAAFVYGEDGRQTITATQSFWVLPFDILIPLIVGILLLILVPWILVRWYVRKKLREMGYANGPRRDGVPSSKMIFLTLGAVLFVLVLLLAVFFLFG